MSEGAEDPGRITAALASILSGTATAAQYQAFQEAAMRSSAVRLDAQSALAFVDGIEQAPTAAPAHLVEQVLASAEGVPSGAIVAEASRRPQRWRVAPRGRMAAACALLLMAGGLTWSLLWRPAGSPGDGLVTPVTTNPKDTPLLRPESTALPSDRTPAAIPAPAAAPATMPPPRPAPAQAAADPCAPRGYTNSEALAEAATAPEPRAAKRAPSTQSKTAAAAPDPGCAADPNRSMRNPAEAGRNPQADQSAVRAARPPPQLGGADRDSPAVLSAPGSAPTPARPASPAMHPSAVAPAR
jgi:hypothetical protein